MELGGCSNGESRRIADDDESACSTPYVSAPSSPGRAPCHAAAAAMYYFSAPASPVHFAISAAPYSASASPDATLSSYASLDFEFSARYPAAASSAGAMASADVLFHNGQIRPMRLSSHLQRPQALAPLLDGDEEEKIEVEGGSRGRDMFSRSLHRRARSMSPMRNSRWEDSKEGADAKRPEAAAPPPPPKNSKRWIFLKDLLHRSKSEGSSSKDKFWSSISFSPSSSKHKSKPPPSPPPAAAARRRGSAPSAHERHYTANRAAAEEMRKRTFLPYRQGLLGCLGFSSRGYGAVDGLARALNPVST